MATGFSEASYNLKAKRRSLIEAHANSYQSTQPFNRRNSSIQHKTSGEISFLA
jgi:hypothetical protein